MASCQSHKKYSLQNMPVTSFTCRDKILGGYYADAETNCQMFHICVKVAGVGVSSAKCHGMSCDVENHKRGMSKCSCHALNVICRFFYFAILSCGL